MLQEANSMIESNDLLYFILKIYGDCPQTFTYEAFVSALMALTSQKYTKRKQSTCL